MFENGLKNYATANEQMQLNMLILLSNIYEDKEKAKEIFDYYVISAMYPYVKTDNPHSHKNKIGRYRLRKQLNKLLEFVVLGDSQKLYKI